MDDRLKQAFSKIKQDISSLSNEINLLRQDLVRIKEEMYYFNKNKNPALRHIISTDATHPSTHNSPFKALKDQDLSISTGNQGASTDRQTDRQTDRHMEKTAIKQENSIEEALNILNSLDDIKKEIRLKFKRLTAQEFLVFTAIYQFDHELGYSDYKLLSQRLNLTESSIRDYVGRIIKKGISVEKKRINNKNIIINISPNLKKIASLSTILQLRELNL